MGWGGGERRWDLKNMMNPHLHHKILRGDPLLQYPKIIEMIPPHPQLTKNERSPTLEKRLFSHDLFISGIVLEVQSLQSLHIKQVSTGCKWTIIREPLWPQKLSQIRGFIFVSHLGIYLVSAVTISSTMFLHRRTKVLQSITGIDETQHSQMLRQETICSCYHYLVWKAFPECSI